MNQTCPYLCTRYRPNRFLVFHSYAGRYCTYVVHVLSRCQGSYIPLSYSQPRRVGTLSVSVRFVSFEDETADLSQYLQDSHTITVGERPPAGLAALMELAERELAPVPTTADWTSLIEAAYALLPSPSSATKTSEVTYLDTPVPRRGLGGLRQQCFVEHVGTDSQVGMWADFRKPQREVCILMTISVRPSSSYHASE